MAITITKPITTFVLVHSFKIDYKEGTQKLRFTADLGEGAKDCYDAVAKVKKDFRWITFNEDNTIKESNLTTKDGTCVELFKATLEEKDGKWQFTSLIRDRDNFEVIHKDIDLLALAIANRKEVK